MHFGGMSPKLSMVIVSPVPEIVVAVASVPDVAEVAAGAVFEAEPAVVTEAAAVVADPEELLFPLLPHAASSAIAPAKMIRFMRFSLYLANEDIGSRSRDAGVSPVSYPALATILE
jgi:hypothetical protein